MSQSTEFVAACVRGNTITELEMPHTPADADQGDCETWGITAEEWSAAIDEALRIKRAEITANAVEAQ